VAKGHHVLHPKKVFKIDLVLHNKQEYKETGNEGAAAAAAGSKSNRRVSGYQLR